METLAELKEFALQNAEVFRGRVRESSGQIEFAERSLGVELPESLTWLLTVWGYSDVCGVDSLTQAISATLRCREQLNLAPHIIILNDWGDAGVVYMDANEKHGGEMPVYWAAAHNFARLTAGQTMDGDVDVFPTFPAWVEDRFRTIGEE